MLEKLPEVLISTFIAAALLALIVGLDSPDDALSSCETSYFIAPSKPFSSEMIDVRKNPGMCSRPNVLGENRVMDGDSYEIIEDAIKGATNELDRAVFSAAGNAAGVGSVCAQYRECLREKSEIRLTLFGGLGRLIFWSVLAGIAISLMRRAGTKTGLGRAIPILLAFLGVAVFSVMEYWGELTFGTPFSMLVIAGTAIFGFGALDSAESSQEYTYHEPTDRKAAREAKNITKAYDVSAALIKSAGTMSPNITRGMTVGRDTTIDALGYSKYLSDLNTSALGNWASEFSRLLVNNNIDVDAKKAEKVIRKGMVKASGGREMMNLEVLTLGQLSGAVLGLLKLRPWAEIGASDRTEYRLPTGIILRLNIDTDEFLALMRSTSRLYPQTATEEASLCKLIEGDRVIVATKKHKIIGVAEAKAEYNFLRDEDKEKLRFKLKNGHKDLDWYREVQWVVILASLDDSVAIGHFADELCCPKSPRRTFTEVNWNGVDSVIRKLEALTKPESGDTSG